MKRKTIVRLLGAAVLSASLLAGCDSGNDSNRGKIEQEEEEEAKPTKALQEPEPVAEPTEEPTPTEAPVAKDIDYRLLELSTDAVSNYYYEDDQPLVTAKATHIELLDDDLPELKQAIDKFSSEREAYVTGESFDQTVEMMLGMKEEMTNGEAGEGMAPSFYYTSYEDYDVNVVRADTVVTSLLSYDESYSGGAHGSYYYIPVNFDSLTGEELHIHDVVSDSMINELPGILEEKLLEKYDAEMFFQADTLAETIEESISMNGDLNFSIGYEGLTFYFQIYELAPYVSGHQTIFLSYADYPGLADEKYTECSNNFIINLEAMGDTIPFSEDTLSAYFTDEDESGYRTKLVIDLNGKEYSEKVKSYPPGSFWVACLDGEKYLIVNKSYGEGYYGQNVYSLDNGKPQLVADYPGGFMHSVPTDPLHFPIYEKCHLMSTYTIYRYYYLSRSGEPASTDEYYLVDTTNNRPYLTVKQSVDAELRDNVDDESYTTTTLSKGVKIYFYAVDPSEWVDFETDDGKHVRFYLDGEDGKGQTIDGVEIEDIFDGISYGQ